MACRDGPYIVTDFLPIVVTTGGSPGGGTYSFSYNTSDVKVTSDEGAKRCIDARRERLLFAVPLVRQRQHRRDGA